MDNNNSRVLVTGITGFLAIHCVKLLINYGYNIRGTIRNGNRDKLASFLRELELAGALEIFEADLEDARVWQSVVEGCEYILHIASPCQIVADDSIVKVAIDGTLNVLRAAYADGKIIKIVLTGSCGAVMAGHNQSKGLLSEKDWSDLGGKYVHPYHMSKTLAEKSAWEFMDAHADATFKLTVLNPSVIVGPLLQNRISASAKLISRFVDGSMLALPKITCGFVSVDDVAEIHVRALREPRSDGQRILLSAKSYSFKKIASILRKEFGNEGYKIPRFYAPYLALSLYARFDDEAKHALRLYGHKEFFDTSKACEIFNFTFTDPAELLIPMVSDMIHRGIVPCKKRTNKLNPKYGPDDALNSELIY